jgi:hypothetical protein
MADSGGNTTGDIIRNIILFLLVGAAILVGVLYLVSELNSSHAADSVEGLRSTISIAAYR